MARPNKALRVCRMPVWRSFVPAQAVLPQRVQLTVEEYEAIRLMDYIGLTQQEAAAQMQVSRSTLQSNYARARRKLAMFLVEGRQLEIQGGQYALCPGCGDARQAETNCTLRSAGKGEHTMKLAICYENGLVFQHFGHTQQFKLYDITDGVITSTQIVDTNGQGHGALAFLLQDLKVDALICGGIGGGARVALAQAGVELYPGCSGFADANAAAFVHGALNYDPNAQCADHGHDHHHEEGHACGSHGCGGHSCH